VILGGAGGLGQVTTAHLIKNYNARVYWLGRRKMDVAIQESIARLSQHGLAPVYIQCDASDEASLKQPILKLSPKKIRSMAFSILPLYYMTD
jgi:polyketide synthase PksN